MHVCDGMWAQSVQLCPEGLFTCPQERWTSLLTHKNSLSLIPTLSSLLLQSKSAARQFTFPSLKISINRNHAIFLSLCFSPQIRTDSSRKCCVAHVSFFIAFVELAWPREAHRTLATCCSSAEISILHCKAKSQDQLAACRSLLILLLFGPEVLPAGHIMHSCMHLCRSHLVCIQHIPCLHYCIGEQCSIRPQCRSCTSICVLCCTSASDQNSKKLTAKMQPRL